jgi:threonine dehydratase
MSPVTYDDVLEALPRVQSALSPTPLHLWPGLSELVGCNFYLKHENHQPVGAFKVRGGINLVDSLSDAERAQGIIGVSTGNHGQSLAFAARRRSMPCTIIVPQKNNPDKVRAMRLLGAEVIERGNDYDEARAHAEQVIQERQARYVHSANEPKLIAGVATLAWEIFEELPEPDVILVPIGLGSGVCGTCIVAKHRRPETQVIGVQAEGADAVAQSWLTGKLVTNERIDTFAEGMATRVPAEMTLEIMRELMDDVVLVSDDELRQSVFEIMKRTHNMAEGAGAASLAAAYQQRERFQHKNVVGILSGGNLDLTELPSVLSGRLPDFSLT